jgi:4'-phosphopantetheinyl transferase
MFDLNSVLWKVEKISDIHLDENLLSRGERDQYNSFKIIKRKNEFLASRILAKKLISDSFNCKLDDIEIKNDNDRKPYAVINKNLSFYISISHRENYIAAAFNRDLSPYIGIDVEIIEKKNRKYLEDFMSSYELASDDENIIRIWTLKEAILKMLGKGLSVSSNDIEIRDDDIILEGRIKDLLNISKISKINYMVVKNIDYLTAIVRGGSDGR